MDLPSVSLEHVGQGLAFGSLSPWLKGNGFAQLGPHPSGLPHIYRSSWGRSCPIQATPEPLYELLLSCTASVSQWT